MSEKFFKRPMIISGRALDVVQVTDSPQYYNDFSWSGLSGLKTEKVKVAVVDPDTDTVAVEEITRPIVADGTYNVATGAFTFSVGGSVMGFLIPATNINAEPIAPVVLPALFMTANGGNNYSFEDTDASNVAGSIIATASQSDVYTTFSISGKHANFFDVAGPSLVLKRPLQLVAGGTSTYYVNFIVSGTANTQTFPFAITVLAEEKE